MTWLADTFLKEHGIDLRLNKYCLQMLKEASERAKIDVGRDAVAKIHIEGICQDPTGKVMDLDASLTEAEFNKMVMDLVQRTFKVCDEALQSARMTAADLDAIILVGGPTRLPIIRTSVRHYFQKDPMAGIDPDEVVAMGAAIQASSLLDSKSEHYLLDVTPLTLRVGTVATSPTRSSRRTRPSRSNGRRRTTNRDGQDKVNPHLSGRVEQGRRMRDAGQFEFSGFRIAAAEKSASRSPSARHERHRARPPTNMSGMKKTTTTIRFSSGLTEDMIQDAQEKNAATQLSRGEAA
jgi:molecular chaperone DnaK